MVKPCKTTINDGKTMVNPSFLLVKIRVSHGFPLKFLPVVKTFSGQPPVLSRGMCHPVAPVSKVGHQYPQATGHKTMGVSVYRKQQQQQTTNNKQQTTNNQQPTTNNNNNKQQTTNNKQPTTTTNNNNKQQTTNNQQPTTTTNNKQQTTNNNNNKQPTTNNQQPTTTTTTTNNNKQPTTNNNTISTTCPRNSKKRICEWQPSSGFRRRNLVQRQQRLHVHIVKRPCRRHDLAEARATSRKMELSVQQFKACEYYLYIYICLYIYIRVLTYRCMHIYIYIQHYSIRFNGGRSVQTRPSLDLSCKLVCKPATSLEGDFGGISSRHPMDVGQNGRPRGPQMEMSSLVLTIQLSGYLILTHTQIMNQKTK